MENLKEMVLTGKCKQQFLEDHRWYIRLLPARYLNPIIVRWFNSNTMTAINLLYDEQEDKYFWVIVDCQFEEFYMEHFCNCMRQYDEAISEAISKSNQIFNNSHS